MTDLPSIHARVKESLNNAEANGYSFEEWTDLQIAEDMIRFDAGMEDEDPLALSNVIAKVRAER